MKKVLDKLITTHNLTKEELVYVLDNLNEEWREYLFKHSKEAKERHYGNTVYMRAISDVSQRVEKGVPVGESMGVFKIFPTILVQLVKVGEETGKLDEKGTALGLKVLDSENEGGSGMGE